MGTPPPSRSCSFGNGPRSGNLGRAEGKKSANTTPKDGATVQPMCPACTAPLLGRVCLKRSKHNKKGKEKKLTIPKSYTGKEPAQ